MAPRGPVTSPLPLSNLSTTGLYTMLPNSEKSSICSQHACTRPQRGSHQWGTGSLLKHPKHQLTPLKGVSPNTQSRNDPISLPTPMPIWILQGLAVLNHFHSKSTQFPRFPKPLCCPGPGSHSSGPKSYEAWRSGVEGLLQPPRPSLTTLTSLLWPQLAQLEGRELCTSHSLV